jgi:hypothetical protein
MRLPQVAHDSEDVCSNLDADIPPAAVVVDHDAVPVDIASQLGGAYLEMLETLPFALGLEL